MRLDETLILGIGNTLLTDEGAGIHALHHLQANHTDIPDLTFIDGGTLSFSLAAWIEDCANLIVFDAMRLNQPSGTVKTFVGTEMDDFLGKNKHSAHEVGLLDLLDIARLTEKLPKNRALIAIQPENMGWGMEPTPTVQDALDTAAAEAIRILKTWQHVSTVQEFSKLKDCGDVSSEVVRQS